MYDYTFHKLDGLRGVFALNSRISIALFLYIYEGKAVTFLPCHIIVRSASVD